jgi:uncharacterized protein (DUF1778 family)
MNASFRLARLQSRISSEDHVLLKRAAKMEGTSVKDFVVSVATAVARLRIKSDENARYSRESSVCFAEMLHEELREMPAMERPRKGNRPLLLTRPLR